MAVSLTAFLPALAKACEYSGNRPSAARGDLANFMPERQPLSFLDKKPILLEMTAIFQQPVL